MGAWLFTRPIISCFHFPSNVFSYMLQTKLTLPHPLDLGMTHYIYGQPLNPMGIYLLCCAHGGERITSHDVIYDAFASILIDVRFHVLQEQTMFFCHLHLLFNFFVDGSTLFC